MSALQIYKNYNRKQGNKQIKEKQRTTTLTEKKPSKQDLYHKKT